MARIEDTIFCDNCGVEITWTPKAVNGFYYCCQDCFDGFECSCYQRTELEEEEHRPQDQSTSAIDAWH